MPPCSAEAFFMAVTRLNTSLCTRARSRPSSCRPCSTSHRELPVGSMNMRLKSLSSRDTGTTRESAAARAILVQGAFVRWSVSTNTTVEGGSASSACLRRAAATRHSSSSRGRSPQLATRRTLGGTAGFTACGATAYWFRSRAPPAAGLEAPANGLKDLRSPETPAAELGAAAPSARARSSPSARVPRSVCSTARWAPRLAARSPSRAVPPMSSVVESEYSERSSTSTSASGRARALAHAS
mmetsp:Transcript_27059/g.75607  ORF Transcript_27059/g.75607 Transcript_27059/m.75607 type:complete len:241 (-) Transcript_27059:87-809(-)